MKNEMKIVMMGIVFMASFGAMAQPGSAGNGKHDMEMKNMTPEEAAKKRTEHLKQELTLTETQTTEVYNINLAHATEMQKLRAEQKALREKMKNEREATRNKIKAVLTTEQNVKFDQMVEEQKQKKEQGLDVEEE